MKQIHLTGKQRDIRLLLLVVRAQTDSYVNASVTVANLLCFDSVKHLLLLPCDMSGRLDALWCSGASELSGSGNLRRLH